MNADAAVGGAVVGGAPRQRRWATKARTGCLTCRSRRVKCDESRPTCNRCIQGKFLCQGYELDLPTQHRAVVLAAHSGSVRGRDLLPQAQQAHASPRLGRTTLPPDWAFMQCYRFCEAPPSSSFNTNQVAMANRNASGADIEVVGPLREPEFGTLHHPVLPMKPVIANNFITLILSEQLSHAAKSRNQMLTVNQDPSLAGLWRQYHICTEECLKFINRNIHGSAKDSAVIVLVAILSLATADEYVDASLWQAHFSGALAFIKHRGGPATVLKMLGTPAPLYFLCCAMLFNNTTSPGKRQISRFYDLPGDELKLVFQVRLLTDTPCPIDMFLSMFHISRLRARIASRGLHATDKLSVQKTLDIISRFDVIAWAKEEYPDQVEKYSLMARLFVVAIRMYGILSLPRSAVVAWARSSPDIAPQSLLTFEKVRGQQKKKLFEVLRLAQATIESAKPLLWPLIVAGVAASNPTTDAADQAFVDQCMMSIWKDPRIKCKYLMLMEKIRAFWRTGKTEWDDCFDEPIQSYC